MLVLHAALTNAFKTEVQYQCQKDHDVIEQRLAQLMSVAQRVFKDIKNMQSILGGVLSKDAFLKESLHGVLESKPPVANRRSQVSWLEGELWKRACTDGLRRRRGRDQLR